MPWRRRAHDRHLDARSDQYHHHVLVQAFPQTNPHICAVGNDVGEAVIEHQFQPQPRIAGKKLAQVRLQQCPGAMREELTLIQSASLNGHDPHAYLKDVLPRLPTQKAAPWLSCYRTTRSPSARCDRYSLTPHGPIEQLKPFHSLLQLATQIKRQNNVGEASASERESFLSRFRMAQDSANKTWVETWVKNGAYTKKPLESGACLFNMAER